jgi:hypothetical protein
MALESRNHRPHGPVQGILPGMFLDSGDLMSQVSFKKVDELTRAKDDIGA